MVTTRLDTSASSAELEILTRQELAKRMKCSVRHLDAQITRGMPCVLLGRSRRFVLTEVLAWLRRQAA